MEMREGKNSAFLWLPCTWNKCLARREIRTFPSAPSYKDTQYALYFAIEPSLLFLNSTLAKGLCSFYLRRQATDIRGLYTFYGAS